MDRDLKIFRDLLLWVWHSHTKPWEYKDAEASEIYAEISRAYVSIGKPEELEVVLPSEASVRSKFLKNSYLYLSPIKVDTTLVPVVAIGESDFGRSIPLLRIRLGVFLKHDNEIKAFGYRFESPEGYKGEHHYYHSQFIHGFEKDRSFLGKEPSWLPVSCPTFPIDADDPVKLLISLLIALYGRPYATQIKASVSGVGKYIDEMHLSKFGSFEWYWCANIGRRTVHVGTEDDPETFNKDFRKQHPNCKIVGITKETYERQSEKFLWQEKRLKRRSATH